MTFSLQELAQLKCAQKRKERGLALDGFSEKILKQLETGNPLYHRVRLYHTENDDYNELWQAGWNKANETEDGEIEWDNGLFFVRHIFGLPFFAHVSDPLGYCEMDHSVKDNVIFVICSNNGNRMFAVSNLEGATFPTLKETCRMEWNRIKADHPHFGDNATASWWSETFGNGSTMTTDKWLLSFMDPAQYEKEIKDMYGYPENWVMHMDTIKREIIGGFQYLGKDFYIMKETQRHQVCGKEIISYYVDDKINLGKWDGHVMFLDDYCEGEPGPMFTEREAVDLLSKGLKKIYGEKQISLIHSSYGFSYEQFIGYRDAAKYLLKGNYNRKRTVALLGVEKANHTFWVHDDPKIEELYPGYRRDHSYNYDYLGRRIGA